MEKLNNKEQKFKALADELEVNLDVDMLWNNIEDQLPNKNKKRRLIFFWWIGLLLIPAALWLTYQSNDAVINNQDDVNNIVNMQSSPASSSQLNQSEPSNRIDNTNKLASNTQVSNVEVNTKSTINKATITNNKKSFSDNNTSKINTKSVNTYPYIQTSNLLPESKKIETTQPNITDDQFVNTSQPTTTPLDNDLAIDQLPLINSSLFINNPQLVMNTPITKIHKHPWRMFIVAGIGTNMSNANHSINSNIENSSTLLNREGYLPSLAANTSLGFQKSAWKLALGLSYYENIARYTDKTMQVSTTQIDGPGVIKINREGSTIILDESVTQTTITNNDLVLHRRNKYIDLTASIGRELLKNRNFSLTLAGDISYNIWSKHSGYYFDFENEKTVSFSKETNPYTDQGLGLGLSFHLNTSIAGKELGIAPYYRNYMANAIDDKNYSFKNAQYGILMTYTWNSTFKPFSN